MDIDFTTVILELINFLILVWLLKRFLYKPILNVVSQRQEGINQQLQEAKTAQEEAEKIQQDYQSRLAQVDRERQQALHLLDEELSSKRTKTLQNIREEAGREEEKMRITQKNKDQQWRREIEQQALVLAARFAGLVFNEVVDENLHHRLVELALQKIKSLEEASMLQLKHQLETTQDATVLTAMPLTDVENKRLQACFRDQLGINGKIEFQQNIQLVAGVRLAVGAWSLGLNLGDELLGFTHCIHQPLSES